MNNYNSYDKIIEHWTLFSKEVNGQLSVPYNRDGIILQLRYLYKNHKCLIVSKDIWPSSIYNESRLYGSIKSEKNSYLEIELSDSSNIRLVYRRSSLLEVIQGRYNFFIKGKYYSIVTDMNSKDLLNSLKSFAANYPNLLISTKDNRIKIEFTDFLASSDRIRTLHNFACKIIDQV